MTFHFKANMYRDAFGVRKRIIRIEKIFVRIKHFIHLKLRFIVMYLKIQGFRIDSFKRADERHHFIKLLQQLHEEPCFDLTNLFLMWKERLVFGKGNYKHAYFRYFRICDMLQIQTVVL